MSSAVHLYEHVLGFMSMKDIGLSLAVACSFIVSPVSRGHYWMRWCKKCGFSIIAGQQLFCNFLTFVNVGGGSCFFAVHVSIQKHWVCWERLSESFLLMMQASLTCICCKTLEHIIVSNINKHLAFDSNLADCQHGFRSQRSCETQLVQFFHDIVK